MITDNRYRRLAFVICVAIGLACATLWGQNVSTPSETTDILIREQMDLAERAIDRDTRLVHLRKALTICPDDPGNLAIKYRIAVELSQRYDPQFPDQTPRRDEAMTVYEGLLKEYRHMDYYSAGPTGGAYDPQMIIPEAYIQLACLYQGLRGDSEKARDCLIHAMDCLKQTYEKRVEDWSNAPAPSKPDPDSPVGVLSAMGKWEKRMAQWNKHRQDAAEGNVLGALEMPVVRAAVRQYGYTYGRQRPYEVPAIMGEIVKMYPDTPMARVAQEHTQRAVAMTDKEMYEELSGKLEDMATVPELGATAETKDKPRPQYTHEPNTGNQSGDSKNWYLWVAGLIVSCITVGLVLYAVKRRR